MPVAALAKVSMLCPGFCHSLCLLLGSYLFHWMAQWEPHRSATSHLCLDLFAWFQGKSKVG